MSAGQVAEVAEVYLKGLQGVELDVDGIDFPEAFLEGGYHVVLLVEPVTGDQ